MCQVLGKQDMLGLGPSGAFILKFSDGGNMGLGERPALSPSAAWCLVGDLLTAQSSTYLGRLGLVMRDRYFSKSL